MIIAANMAEGANQPFGYNLLSESSIAQIQLFSAFILRHVTMRIVANSYAVTVFADTESARHEKVLMNGIYVVLNGYAVPLPLNFTRGGISITGNELLSSLIHGVTADNYLDGSSELIPELVEMLGDRDNGDDDEDCEADNNKNTKRMLFKLARLAKTHPIGIS